jgi:hypothetical protein
MDGTWSPSEIKKTARIIQISSKRPTENTERKWWEPPNKMWKMDPDSGEYHTRSKTLRHLILSVPLSLVRMMTSGWPLQPSYSDRPGDQDGGHPSRESTMMV